MIRKILTYSSGEVFVKGMAFLAIPLYSNLILPQEYGVLGFLNSLVSFLPFILTFYYLYAYVRFSVDVDEVKLISTYFYLGLFLNLFYFFTAIALYYLFINEYGIDLNYFVLSITSSSAVYMFQILQMYHRSQGLAKKYIKFSVIYSVFGILLNLSLLFFLDDNILAMLLSSSLTSISLSFIAYNILKNHIQWTLFDIKLVAKILKYTLPLVPGAVALLIFSQSDKIILINYISKEELGVYNLAFTLGLSMAYIGSAFFMSYQPIFYEKISQGLKQEIQEQFWKNIIFLLFSLLISFFVIFIAYKLVNIRYIDGMNFSFIIAIAYSFIAFAQMMELHLTYINKTYLVSLVYGVGGVFTISSLFYLIPLYGAKGAAISLLLSAFVISVIMYIIAQKYLFISYNKYFLSFFYIFTLSAGWIVV